MIDLHDDSTSMTLEITEESSKLVDRTDSGGVEDTDNDDLQWWVRMDNMIIIDVGTVEC